MNRYYFIGAIIILIIGLSQFPGIQFWIGGKLVKSYSYQSKNEEFTFVEIPQKGRDIALMERQVKIKKEQGLIPNEIFIYRTSKREWYKFWNWYDYLTHNRWKYPFLKV